MGNYLKHLTLAIVMLCSFLAWSDQVEHKVHFEKTDFELHVFKIKGRLPGRTLMIIGGIQGNEPGGYISADKYADIRLKKGNIIVVPRANFLSILRNRRQINEDMNRRFSQSKIKIEEDKVVSVLKDLMHESDFLLNLHEGSGFYNPKYIDSMNNPKRYGQSIIADTDVFFSKRCNCELRLKEMAERVIKKVNLDIDREQYKFRFNNHNTASAESLHQEQRKSATYYALYHAGIPAFGIETSKSIKDLELKVWMHSQIINAFIEEIGIEFESPAVDVKKPRLEYLLVRINDEYKVITRSDILFVPKNAKIEIKDIETNYDRGVTADIMNLGSLHDYGKVFKIKNDTSIVVRKDSQKLATIPVRVKESETSSFIPPRLVNKPKLVWLVVNIDGVERIVHPDERIETFEGVSFKIEEAVFYPPVQRKNVIVNFVGYPGGTKYSIEDDLGLSFRLNGSLWKRYAIKKDLYQSYIKYKDQKIGKFYVKIKRPEIKYFILETKIGRLAYLSREKVELNDPDIMIYDIISEAGLGTVKLKTQCGSMDSKGFKTNIKELLKCSKEKYHLQVLRDDVILGSLDLVFK
jgi:hypothetical protein